MVECPREVDLNLPEVDPDLEVDHDLDLVLEVALALGLHLLILGQEALKDSYPTYRT